jgi:hypothetical protein
VEEQIVTFETAILAKEKKFSWNSNDFYNVRGKLFSNGWCENIHDIFEEPFKINNELLEKSKLTHITAPTQTILQKFIREKRGVHINIHRNASGYYWSMCISDGGTDLGWSNHTGPNLGGVWKSYEDTLENALQVQLSYDLPKDKSIIKHWANYAEFAIKEFKIKYHER